jgi:hypothetical protein
MLQLNHVSTDPGLSYTMCNEVFDFKVSVPDYEIIYRETATKLDKSGGAA